MTSHPRPFLPLSLRQTLLRAALAATAAAFAGTALLGCGGDNYTPSPLSTTDHRALSTAFTTRAAVSYSPYRTSTSEAGLNSEVITAANVEQDLRLIQATGIGMIRLFSSRAFAETVLTVIRDKNLDLRVMLGSYVNPVSTPAHEADNQAELAKTIALANTFRSIVEAVSVGNETMVSWSTHKIEPERMAGYILQVRKAITQPVTTDDNWAFWAAVPKVIADVVDFAAVHTYPLLDTFYDPGLWDWRFKTTDPAVRAQAMANGAIAEAKRQFGMARSYFDRIGLQHVPMVIGETGWTAVDAAGGPALGYRVHPVNQKLYFDRLQAWAQEGRRGNGPQAMFYFQAFDEPWKQGDDGWGLFNKDRQARYVVQGLGTCGVTWACEPGNYTAANAVSWVAPVVNTAVAANRYTLFADTATPGEARPAGLRWDPFATTGYRVDGSMAPSTDGPNSFEITPNPANYGWGLFHYSASGVTENLSAFGTTGRLNFAVKTDNYPGKIEVGITTDTEDRDVQEAYLQIAPGEYGYCNTNQWCNVSIPVSAFLAANPKLDLRLVSFRFVIADRYSFTGKPLNTAGLPKIHVDNIHWTR